MKKIYVISVILIFSSFFVAQWFLEDKQTSVLKYFPIDETVSFTSYGTELNMLRQTDQDEYDIKWSSYSLLDKPVYLRQDVSLLYADGRLMGILSKWKENEQNIKLQSMVHGEDSSHYQTITFHHGELHYPDDKIKSIQAMSSDELYVIDSPYSALESFDQPTNYSQKEWKNTLDRATNQQLRYYWKQLIDYFQIPENKYEFVPLTDIGKYQQTPIPTLNQQQTDRVIGQLWEGIYKNYIIPLSSNKKPVKSFVPLVLFDKEGEQLMVLFENEKGQKEQLVQLYPR
ncbi:hypothetical protein [Aquibacillus salsiterrae]|uniref:Uncharacterized protein n=1 Tax=Aquibacillus salsiterrae TaxID=2950439 RepID=A0A9X3WDM9_9BACI|nr:hypothetical protein [Aquibacillus salsiterrae]MDC3415519.1 hypothetical protein [Aquibacillus salsiterrae]